MVSLDRPLNVPALKPKPSREGWVYVATLDRDARFVKIGHTTRTAEIRTAEQPGLRLAWWLHVGDCRAVEAAAHNALTSRWVGPLKETFRATVEEARDAVEANGQAVVGVDGRLPSSPGLRAYGSMRRTHHTRGLWPRVDVWIAEEHDEMEQFLREHGPDWAAAAAFLFSLRLGLKPREKPSPSYVRAAWKRVRETKTRAEGRFMPWVVWSRARVP